MRNDRSIIKNCDSDERRSSDSASAEYCIRVGSFRNYNMAMELQLKLVEAGFPVDIERRENSYAVITYSIRTLDQAAFIEYCLRCLGYSTVIYYADSDR